MTQKELEWFLEEYHRAQDKSHEKTLKTHNEIMRMIDKAREGLHATERQTCLDL